MDRPKLEVADIFRRYGAAYREQHGASMSTTQRRVMTAIELCRTAALGGHLERCDECGHERNCFNSCRDRHCPKCQSLARSQWIEDRQSELLEVPHFHVVFTVPEEIAAIACQNKKVVYSILFHVAAGTLTTIAADPKPLGAQIGFFAWPVRSASVPRGSRCTEARLDAAQYTPTTCLDHRPVCHFPAIPTRRSSRTSQLFLLFRQDQRFKTHSTTSHPAV